MSLEATKTRQLLLQKELLGRNLKEFIRAFWTILEPATPFIDGYHLDAICDHLTNIEQIENLLICLPPGFAKSLTHVFWFCWVWARTPSERFIFASHALALSQRDSLRCRRIIESPLYQQLFGSSFTIMGDQDTKTRYENNKTGFRLATSVDSGVTGERGNYAVVDDPHNVKEIESQLERDNVIRWYSESFSNRINPIRGYRIIIGQRTHARDLAGHILKNDKEDTWTKLILPLEYGRCPYVSTYWRDPRTLDGELLCPALYSQKKVTEQKQQSRNFDTQYNQSPKSIGEGFTIEDLRFYDSLPTERVRIAAVDMAISGKGDYTVIVVADITPKGEIYVVHLHREKMQGIQVVPTLEGIVSEYSPKIVFIEDFGSQAIVVQEARQKRIPARGVHHKGSKEMKAETLASKIAAQQVFLPKGTAWVAELKEELQEFPGGIHDDQVDALSIAATEGQKLYRGIPTALPVSTMTAEQQQAELTKRYNAALMQGMNW